MFYKKFIIITIFNIFTIFSQKSYQEAYRKAVKDNVKTFMYQGQKYSNNKYTVIKKKKLKKQKVKKKSKLRTLSDALQEAIEGNKSLFTYKVGNKTKTYTNKSYITQFSMI